MIAILYPLFSILDPLLINQAAFPCGENSTPPCAPALFLPVAARPARKRPALSGTDRETGNRSVS